LLTLLHTGPLQPSSTSIFSIFPYETMPCPIFNKTPSPSLVEHSQHALATSPPPCHSMGGLNTYSSHMKRFDPPKLLEGNETNYLHCLVLHVQVLWNLKSQIYSWCDFLSKCHDNTLGIYLVLPIYHILFFPK
jgi:hypothetical protein